MHAQVWRCPAAHQPTHSGHLPLLPLQPMGWCQVRGLLLPASLLLLAASVALAAGTPAASAVDSGSSAVAQLAAVSARLLSSALVLCGRGLLHFTSAVGGESSAGLTARAMSAMRGSGRLLLSLFGSGQLQAAWRSSGLGALLDECTNFWVRVPAARRLLRAHCAAARPH